MTDGPEVAGAAAGNGAVSTSFVPLVRLDRGGRVEVVMHGAVVVVRDDGALLASCGNPDLSTYLRSSVKMIQALPLVRSGAADAFGLTPRHLAVCCASHSGEDRHLAAVREILAACGRAEEDLHCGPHPPFHRPSAEELVRRGEKPRAIHSDCSGKHSGMIATCVHRGWPVDGYWRGDHPLQQEIRAGLAGLAGTELPPFAVDGCGVPTFYLPIRAFALALARFASGAGPAAADAPHVRRLFDAMVAHADMVAGTDRICTELVAAARVPLLAKGGAEGVYGAAWRDAEGRGVALVVKAAAGDSRSRDFATVEALRQLGVLDDAGVARLARFHRAPVRNWAGTEVGALAPLFTLSAASPARESGLDAV